MDWTKERLKSFVEERIFYSPDGCWYWTGYLNDAGYGVIDLNRRGIRKVLRATRVYYEIKKGPIPDGYHICHRCDNPACVNPDHLFAGTREENMLDMINKGRSPKGSKHGNAILKESDIADIRNLISKGFSMDEIAVKFNVSATAIYDIKAKRTWSHI
jgi:HNH endonuclease